MSERTTKWSKSEILACLAIVLICITLWELRGVHQSVDGVLAQVASKRTTMETKWNSAGLNHSFLTHLGELDPREGDLQHSARHQSGVQSMLAIFPKQE